MRLATLTGVDVPSRRFKYTLSVPYSRLYFGPDTIAESTFFEVFSREDFTKVWSEQRRELYKSLPVVSHWLALDYLGYIRAVDLSFVQDCTDEELLTCLAEFEKTGDDISPFEWELGNR